MRTYGDEALFAVSCDRDRFPPSKPALMQFSDRFILLGNPIAGIVGNKSYDMEIVRNRTPIGEEIISDNPNVTSGGGSIPRQPYYVNGGVDDNQTAWDRIISGVVGSFSSNGIFDPARATDAEKNDNGIGCNCNGNVSIDDGTGDGTQIIDSGPGDGLGDSSGSGDGSGIGDSSGSGDGSGIGDGLPCCGPLDNGAPCNPDPNCSGNGDSSSCPTVCPSGGGVIWINGKCLCTADYNILVPPPNPNSSSYGSISSMQPSAALAHVI